MPHNKEIISRWLLAIGCFAVLVFFFSPSWGAWHAWARAPELGVLLEVRRGVSVLQQMETPGAAITDPLHAAIQWRLLFPLVGKGLHLPPAVLFGLAHVGCALVLGFVISQLRRAHVSWLECALITLVLGATAWFFTSTSWLGYFDSWLVLALLIVAFADRNWTVWFACLWAPWVDERFVLGVPLALFCRFLRRQGHDEHQSPAVDWRRECLVPACLIVLFLIVRLGILGGHSATGVTISGYWSIQRAQDAQWTRVALGIWDGLRVAWLGVIAVVMLRGGLRSWQRAALGAGVAVVMLVGLATAQDYSRSMMLVFPVALFGFIRAANHLSPRLPWTLRFAAIAALLLPAHHVMNDRVNPIFYLYHELAALNEPPPILNAQLYELGAIHAMEVGNFELAEVNLMLAIKLADNPAGPSKQRGVMRASQGHWEEARRDFATVVEHDPQNPDGWFLRAQAELALGDLTAARADMQRALALGGEAWARRPDVTRFSARLK